LTLISGKLRAENRSPRGCLRGFAALFAALFLIGMSSMSASATTKSLKLYFVHTGEKAEITFKKDGKFIPSGLQQLNRFLRDWRRNEPTKMNPRLFDLIWEVYRESGSSDYIHVVSGYRSPQTNAMLRSRTRGVAKHSQHMLGNAMDYFLPDVPLAKLRKIGLRLQEGGVGYYPTSGSPFVHMDVGSVRHWPRMTRKELLAVFPNGKTLHIPTDGKPLPGYEIALADYKRRMANESGSFAVASADETPSSGTNSKRKGRGLLATLFGVGGGADEEEDVASEGPAVASAQDSESLDNTATAVTTVKQETYVTALPETGVPVPMAAPRPEATIAVADASANVGADKLLAALEMPAPSPRPTIHAISVASANVSGSAIPAPPSGAFANRAPMEKDDQIRNVLLATLVQDRLGTSATNANLTAYAGRSAILSAPTPRFAPRQQNKDNFADLPQQLPAPEMRGATAPKEGRLRPGVQLASLQTSPVTANAARPANTRSKLAVHTAPRQAKPAPSDVEPDASPIVVPVDPQEAEWAFNAGKVPEIHSSKERARAIMYSPPSVVLTAGFATHAPDADPHRFSGTAVSFLSVAKFQAKN
jgi:uncharacterized protein YcbK (DUF882 family)